APSTTTGNVYGYVFNNCTIDGASSQDGIYNLGRPWQNSPRAVYLNTKMNILASAGAWGNMSTIPALFAEYNTVNASNNPVVLTSRNTAYSYVDGNSNTITGNSPTAVLTAQQAADYTLANVLGGGDSWDASLKTEQTSAPANLSLNTNTLSWDATEGAICYIILKDDAFLQQTTATSLTASNDTYEIMAVSEHGALSAKTSLQVEGLTTLLEIEMNASSFLRSTSVKSDLELLHPENVQSLAIYQLSGQQVMSNNKPMQYINLEALSAGCYILQLQLKSKIVNLKLLKQ
ncbi:MAG: T9SS type A sorting domain-containing protein, partial [Paludibacter sp.]